MFFVAYKSVVPFGCVQIVPRRDARTRNTEGVARTCTRFVTPSSPKKTPRARTIVRTCARTNLRFVTPLFRTNLAPSRARTCNTFGEPEGDEKGCTYVHDRCAQAFRKQWLCLTKPCALQKSRMWSARGVRARTCNRLHSPSFPEGDATCTSPSGKKMSGVSLRTKHARVGWQTFRCRVTRTDL